MYAAATSGGKESTLALHRALAQGLPVTHLFHVYGAEHGRVRFHGYRPRVILAQAEALGLEAIVEPTGADTFERDFARALGRAKEAGLEGIVFGNVWLEDVRDYYRRLVEAARLKCREMLWGEQPAGLLAEFAAAGFRAVVTCVWLDALDRSFLGRQVDRSFIDDLAALEGVDPCGERGEYHTLVHDGPIFRRPVPFTTHGVHEEGNYALLDLRTP